jgi:hypothetical protein
MGMFLSQPLPYNATNQDVHAELLRMEQALKYAQEGSECPPPTP